MDAWRRVTWHIKCSIRYAKYPRLNEIKHIYIFLGLNAIIKHVPKGNLGGWGQPRMNVEMAMLLFWEKGAASGNFSVWQIEFKDPMQCNAFFSCFVFCPLQCSALVNSSSLHRRFSWWKNLIFPEASPRKQEVEAIPTNSRTLPEANSFMGMFFTCECIG